jgi:hypothetical protein
MKTTDMLKRGRELFFAEPPDFQKAKDFFQQVTVSAPE